VTWTALEPDDHEHEPDACRSDALPDEEGRVTSRRELGGADASLRNPPVDMDRRGRQRQVHTEARPALLVGRSQVSDGVAETDLSFDGVDVGASCSSVG